MVLDGVVSYIGVSLWLSAERDDDARAGIDVPVG
jgi:hypothetical protein